MEVYQPFISFFHLMITPCLSFSLRFCDNNLPPNFYSLVVKHNFPAAYVSNYNNHNRYISQALLFSSLPTYGYPAYDLSKSCSADKLVQQPQLTAAQAMITCYLTVFSFPASLWGGSLSLWQEQGRLKKCLDVSHEVSVARGSLRYVVFPKVDFFRIQIIIDVVVVGFFSPPCFSGYITDFWQGLA